MLCTATQFVAALLATQWYFDVDAVRSSAYEVSQLKKTPRLIKFYWLLHDVSLPLALIITTIYWSFLHGKMSKFEAKTDFSIEGFFSQYPKSAHSKGKDFSIE